MTSFGNQPKILRGAFVEYERLEPPLFVVFQFNPVQLSRSRTLSYEVPGSRSEQQTETGQPHIKQAAPSSIPLRDFHSAYEDLLELRDAQQVKIEPESINFEIRLDATDSLNDGDPVAGRFGIAPQLATLELMTHPKEESFRGTVFHSLAWSPGFSYTRTPNPPMVLFVWGTKRVLPVNINSLNITETEFSTTLEPIRATVAVSLSLIEGPNPAYFYSKVLKESSSVLNLAGIARVANVVIPG
jgi:hypothetical protein